MKKKTNYCRSNGAFNLAADEKETYVVDKGLSVSSPLRLFNTQITISLLLTIVGLI